jgi:hypothetical protein
VGNVAEVHLPAREGPGVGADQQAAVERNMKAVAFLMAAMPDLQIINVMLAGLSDVNWPNEPKAHLMMAYLRENFVELTALSRVGARRDLENCTLKKDENPNGLFEKLTAVQFKYHGNAQANVTDDDLVAQAVQALPAVYNSTVAGSYKTERRAGNAVTLNGLKRAVCNHYAIVLRGKTGAKVKDIEGGFAAMEVKVETKEKDNLKRMIQETINTTIWEFQEKHQAPAANHAIVEGLGTGAMNGSNGAKAVKGDGVQ